MQEASAAASCWQGWSECAPTGDIRTAAVLGEKLFLLPAEIGTELASKQVFHFELPINGQSFPSSRDMSPKPPHTSCKPSAVEARFWSARRNHAFTPHASLACLLMFILPAHFCPVAIGATTASVPDKLVVLTFDDSVKSHRTFVAPLLKELGFGATFFVTHAWMNDPTNFMTWDEIGEIHEMGFEIGNHSWTHSDFSQPKNAARLTGELYLVDSALAQTKAKVVRPFSFAYCGNTFGPEAVQKITYLGYKFARRGGMPEARYGTLEIGATYKPKRHHPLLIPTTGDAYPYWSLEQVKEVVARATNGQIVVLQFHGVPDVAHPWVHTPPERFR